jgi:hypothetical protein
MVVWIALNALAIVIVAWKLDETRGELRTLRARVDRDRIIKNRDHEPRIVTGPPASITEAVWVNDRMDRDAD